MSDYFPFLSLPNEIRREIYRQLLFADHSVGVEVVSSYQDGPPPHAIQLYTLQDLRVLEVNRLVQAEASEVFYAEKVFVLYLYSSTNPYGYEDLYGHPCYRIDLSRAGHFHLTTPRGYYPQDDFEIKEAMRIQYHLKYLAKTLDGAKHAMRYLLIKSYHFEFAALDEPFEMALDIKEILRPLESVRGIDVVYVRSMKKRLFPYLRWLEENIIQDGGKSEQPSASNITTQEHPIALDRAPLKVVSGDEGNDFDDNGESDDFIDPDDPYPHRFFELFGESPFYGSTDFVRKCMGENF